MGSFAGNQLAQVFLREASGDPIGKHEGGGGFFFGYLVCMF